MHEPRKISHKIKHFTQKRDELHNRLQELKQKYADHPVEEQEVLLRHEANAIRQELRIVKGQLRRSRHHYVQRLLPLASVFLVIALIAMFQPEFIGQVTGPDKTIRVQTDIETDGLLETSYVLDDIPSSFSLSGEIIGTGDVTILARIGTEEYVVIDRADLDKGRITDLTSPAVKKPARRIRFNNECKDTCLLDVNNTNITLVINTSNATVKLRNLNYVAKKAEIISEEIEINKTENATINNTIIQNVTENNTENNTINETTPDNETLEDIINLTQNITENITGILSNDTENITNVFEQNETINITENVTLNLTQNITENLSVTNETQNITDNVTINYTVNETIRNESDNETQQNETVEIQEPLTIRRIPEIMMEPNSALTLDLKKYFDNKVKLEITSSEHVSTSVKGTKVVFEADEQASGTVQLEGKITKGEQTGQFTLRVRLLKVTEDNIPPIATNIPELDMEPNMISSLSLSKYFEDPDGDEIEYSVEDVEGYTLTLDNEVLTISAETNAQSTEISITASDGKEKTTSKLPIAIIQEQTLEISTVIMTDNEYETVKEVTVRSATPNTNIHSTLKGIRYAEQLEITGNVTNITVNDSDNNGVMDSVEWTVPEDGKFQIKENHLKVKHINENTDELEVGEYTKRIKYAGIVNERRNGVIQAREINLPAISDIEFENNKGMSAKVTEASTKPKLTLNRWNDEAALDIQLSESPGTVQTENGKISIDQTENLDINTIPLDSRNDIGGIEFDIVLETVPTTNKWNFDINSKNLEFYYQPPLDKELGNNSCNATDCQGHHRPIDVVGSYAAYHSSKKDNEYKSGKAFHIYRPKVYDNVGNEIWGKLNISNGTLHVTVNKDWLDNAQYPVTIDPTFGYTTAGSSEADYGDTITAGQFTGAAGTAANITAYTRIRDDSGIVTHYYRYALYDSSDNLIAQTSQGSSGASAASWRRLAFGSGQTISAVDYKISVWGNYRFQLGMTLTGYIAYDSGGTGGTQASQIYSDSGGTSYPDPWSPSSNTNKYSIYVEYSASGGGSSDNAPSVTLNSPTDSSTNENGSVTFQCTVTDDNDIANITLNGNFSGTWTNKSRTIRSGTADTSYVFNTTINLVNGTYIWNCQAFDNNSNESWASANYTITVDEPADPVIQDAIVLPATPGTAQDLIGYCNATDEDTSQISYYYRWYQNGVLNETGGNSASGISCYQETATTSTACGGLDTGRYITSGTWNNPTNTYDGDWGTQGGTTLGNTGNLYINYTKPSGARNDSVWQIKSFTDTRNLSLTNDCFNQNPLQLRVYSDRSGSIQTIWYCYDGSSWTTLYTDSGAGNYQYVYEEAMYWRIGETYTQGIKANVANITSSDTSLGDNWSISCLANDGNVNTTWLNSSNITIITDPSPVVSLNSPVNNTEDADGNVTFSCEVSDDQDIVNITIYGNFSGTWTNKSRTTRTGTSDTSYIYNVTLDLADKGFIWGCMAYDNSSQATWSANYTLSVNSNLQSNYTEYDSPPTTDYNNIQNISNVCYPKLTSAGTGQIQWRNCVNASHTDFDRQVHIGNNLITVNSSIINPSLNSSANITFYGLTYETAPTILRNGVVCPSNICQALSYSAGTFVFNVSKFSNYSTVGNAKLGIWDDEDIEAGSQEKNSGDNVVFYANYTNSTDDSRIDDYSLLWMTSDIDVVDKTYHVRAIDLDNDGKKDEMIIAISGNIRAFYENGTEETGNGWPASEPSTIQSMVVGDLNNDGYENEFVIGDSNCHVMTFNRTGQQVWDSGSKCARDANVVFVEDFDKDGIKDDIAVGTTTGNDNPIYLIVYNTTDGQTWRHLWNVTYDTDYLQGITDLVVSDFDRDGDSNDIAVALRTSYITIMPITVHALAHVETYVGENGTMIFNTTDLGTSNMTAIEFGDINQDGNYDDVLAANGTHVLGFRFSGTYDEQLDVTHSFLNISGFSDPLNEIIVGDFDGDGYENDILTGDGNSIDAYDNQSNTLWNFNAPNQVITSLVVDDLNQDGKNEIIAGGADETIWILNTSGSLVWKSNLSQGKMGEWYSSGHNPAVDSTNKTNGIKYFMSASEYGFGHYFQPTPCKIQFNDSSVWHSMIWNDTIESYVYNRTFNVGNYSYTTICNGSFQGFDTINLTDNIEITDYSYDLTSCRDISVSGEHTLTQDISDNSSSFCFDVTADDVTINCDGYTISGNDSNVIRAESVNRFTLKNCNITLNKTGADYAVYLNNSNYTKIHNNTLMSDSWTVYSGNSTHTNITYNNVSSFGSFAVNLYARSNYGLVQNNIITVSTTGLSIHTTNFTRVINNTINASSLSTIRFTAGNYQEFKNNKVITGGSNGILATTTSDLNITYSSFDVTSNSGIWLASGSNWTINHNNVSVGGLWGIRVPASGNNFTIINNTVDVTSTYGVLVYGNNVTVHDNNITADQYALDIISQDANILNNYLNVGTSNLIRSSSTSRNIKFTYNNSYGEVRWHGGGFNITESGTLYFGDGINITNNFIEVNPSIFSALNDKATLTLYNTDSLGISHREPYRNGLNCSTSVCEEITDADTYVFNVTHFTNYSVGEHPPNTPSPIINSTDGTNTTTQDLNCNATITDDHGDILNVSVIWYKNGVLDQTIDYNNDYASGSSFNSVLYYKNTTLGENWSCSIRTYDGKAYSEWNESSNLTIEDSKPTITLQNYFTNSTTAHWFSVKAGTHDYDGFGDISSVTITNNNCSYSSNTSNGNYLNVTYNCSAYPLLSNSMNITFCDNAGLCVNTTQSSNTYPNNAPTLGNLVINATTIINKSADKLNVYFTQSDTDSDTVTNITDWRLNGRSLAFVNMPFDVNQSGTIVKDYSTYGNDGTLGGGIYSPKWNSSGQIGGAYRFDGVDDAINLGDIEFGNMDEISISAWVKTSDTISTQRIVSKDQVGTNGNIIMLFTLGDWRFQAYDTSDTTWSWAVYSSTVPNDGNWHHFVGTIDQTDDLISLYIDGILIDTDAFGAATLDDSDNEELVIGSDSDVGAYDQTFNGSIDEVLIFNRSLSAEQINTMYLAGLAGHSVQTIDSQETTTGDNWSVTVTSTDQYEDGTSSVTENITIQANPDLIINMTYPLVDSNITINTIHNVTFNISCNTTKCINTSIGLYYTSEIPENTTFNANGTWTTVLRPGAIEGKDTFVAYADDNYDPNTNYGSSDSMRMRYYSNSYHLETFIEFNISSIPIKEVVDANLELYLYDASTSQWNGNTVTVGRITSAWSENTVTGNTAPTRDATNFDTETPTEGNYQYYKWDVLTPMQNWEDGTWPHYGFVLRVPSATGRWGYAMFRTSDYSDGSKRPKLTVTYWPNITQVETSTTTPLWTATGNPSTPSDIDVGSYTEQNYLLNGTGAYNSVWSVFARTNLSYTIETSNYIDFTIVPINEIPTTPVVTINSTDGTNHSNQDLNCMATLSDLNSDNLNVTVSWYKNGALDQEIEYNNSYPSGTVFNATLYYKNTTTDDSWNCSMITHDGTDFSSKGASTALTIVNTLPVIDLLTLNATTIYNTSNDNITIYINTTDVDGDNISNVTDWRLEGTSIAVVNMPFNNNVSSTTADAVIDYSTYAHHGTLAAAMPTWSNTGKVGGSFDFDGVDDHITTSSFSRGSNAISLSVWFKLDTHDAVEGNWIANQRDNIANDQWQIFVWTNEQLGITLFDSSGTGLGSMYAPGTIPTNEWIHAAFTTNGNNGDNLSMYVNGVEVNSTILTADVNDALVPLIIGTRGWSTSKGEFDGHIDELLLFNRALSPEQITTIYQAGRQNHSVNTIVSQETSTGDNWTVAVTPFDTEGNGTTVLSDNITIRSQCDVGGDWSITNSVSCQNQNVTIDSLNIRSGGNLTLTNVTLRVRGKATIHQGGTFIAKNGGHTLWFNKNLTINGTARWVNETIRMNGTYDNNGSAGIKVNGNLTVLNSSNITVGDDANYRYFFVVNPKAELIINDSFISNVGWKPHPFDSLVLMSSTLPNRDEGMIISANSSYIARSTFTDSYHAIIYNSSDNHILINSTFHTTNSTNASAILVMHSENNMFYGLNISTDANSSLAIHAYDFNNSIITNSNITTKDNTSIALVIIESNNTNITHNLIRTHDIFGAYGAGIFILDSMGIIIDNNSVQTNNYIGQGISTYRSNQSIIRNNNIVLNGIESDGISSVNTTQCLFSGNTIDVNGLSSSAMEFQGSYKNLIYDSDYQDYTDYAIEYYDTYSNNTFVNVTFGTGDIGYTSGGTGQVWIQWYLDVYVNDSDGNDVAGIEVNISDRNSVLTKNGTTNGVGRTKRFNVTDYLEEDTGTTWYSNYSLVAGNKSHNGSTTVNLTSNKLVNITIEPKGECNVDADCGATGWECISLYCFSTEGRFVVQNATNNITIIDKYGQMAITGSITQSCGSSPDGNDFVIQTGGSVGAWADDQTGDWCISGSLFEDQGVLTPAGNNDFIIENETTTVAYGEGSNGNMYLRKKIVQNAII